MSLLTLIITLAVIGFVVWLVLQIPMPEVIRSIIVGVVAFFVILYLLQSFGALGSIGNLRLR